MTRDEATRLVRDGGPIGGVYKSYDEALVDSLVALGILKLDEPISVIERAELALGQAGYSYVGRRAILEAIRRAGLRIVEK